MDSDEEEEDDDEADHIGVARRTAKGAERMVVELAAGDAPELIIRTALVFALHDWQSDPRATVHHLQRNKGAWSGAFKALEVTEYRQQFEAEFLAWLADDFLKGKDKPPIWLKHRWVWTHRVLRCVCV